MRSVVSIVERDDEDGLISYLAEPGGHHRDELHSVKNVNGECALHIAVRNNNSRIVKLLLESGAEPTLLDGKGQNSYQIAIVSNHLRILEILLQTCPPKKRYGLVPLAVQSNSLESLEMLLENGIPVDERSSNGTYALHMAAQMGNLEMTKMLLKYKADIDQSNFNSGKTALYYTISLSNPGCEEVFNYLLSEKADPNWTDNILETPLHQAVRNEKLSYATRLLSKGAKIDMPNDKGETPLYAAIKKNNVLFVAFLLEYGANPNYSLYPGLMYCLKTSGNTTVNMDNLTIVCLLLKYGADPNMVMNTKGETIMYYASMCDINVLKLLLHDGGNLNIQNKQGTTPFYRILLSDHDHSMNKLELALKYGADVTSPIHEGRTAIQIIAFQHDDQEITKKKLDLLIEYGADINDKESKKMTILYAAITNLRDEHDLWRIEYFLSKKADPNILVDNNYSLWDVIVFDLDTQITDTVKRKLIRLLIKGGLKFNENLCKRLKWYKSIAAAYRMLPLMASPNAPLALLYATHSFLC